jgi:hypothetical protein
MRVRYRKTNGTDEEARAWLAMNDAAWLAENES